MNGRRGALDYLFGLERFGTVFGLDNIRWILGLIGNPERSFATVHVGGTNGKGSVTAMLTAMLRAAGYKVGAYTSPHLVSFGERIAVDDAQMTDEAAAGLVDRLRREMEGSEGTRPFTFFDFTTAMAFLHFREQGVEIAVVEVGMGGRLDSTNVVSPVASVITNVERDHEDFLGETARRIAHEKAGIIKKEAPVITGASGEALTVIEERARALASPLYVLGKDFSYRKRAERSMDYKGLRAHLNDVRVNLRGDHQLANAALALCASEVLAAAGYPLEEADALRGLASVEWPGRLEIIGGRPLIVLDGAHNPHASRTLAEYLRTYLAGRRKVLLFGVMRDKEYAAMLRELVPAVDAVILTAPAMARSLQPEEMACLVPGGQVYGTVPDALRAAKRDLGDNDCLIVTGSLFLVGEVKRYLHEIL